MKNTRFVLLASLIFAVACGTVKTRKEAAADAKLKAATAEEGTPPVGPIDEDIPDGMASGDSKPVEDQVLDDELAKMGIDPNNPSGKVQGTPEPEKQSSVSKAPAKKAKKPVKKTKKM